MLLITILYFRNMKLYFCGSIRGGRQDQAHYAKIVEHMKTFGTVLTEAVANPELTEEGEGD